MLHPSTPIERAERPAQTLPLKVVREKQGAEWLPVGGGRAVTDGMRREAAEYAQRRSEAEKQR